MVLSDLAISPFALLLVFEIDAHSGAGTTCSLLWLPGACCFHGLPYADPLHGARRHSLARRPLESTATRWSHKENEGGHRVFIYCRRDRCDIGGPWSVVLGPGMRDGVQGYWRLAHEQCASSTALM